MTDLINLNGTILWGNADLETSAYAWGYQTNGDSDLYFMDFNVDVNFMKRRFTPVLSAGIGSVRFVGYAYGADLEESDLSWNLAGGVRWDALDHLLITALYRGESQGCPIKYRMTYWLSQWSSCSVRRFVSMRRDQSGVLQRL